MADEKGRQYVGYSVSGTCEDYTTNEPIWTRCRDVIAGSDAVKAKGETYLPKLPGHDNDTYDAYKLRALFYGAVKRTIKGMSGMVFMKEPTVENVPDDMQYLLKDVTYRNVTLFSFAKNLLNEVLGIGRVGVWVDMPRVGAADKRPYVVDYEAEQIINWRTERIDGRMMVTLVVLAETYTDLDPANPYTSAEVAQYRVLTLEVGANGGRQYVHRLFREAEIENPSTKKKEKAYFIYDEVVPLRNGVPLDFIPFLIIGPETIDFEVEEPPVLAMVDVSLSHYRTSADLENGRHWCGTPQPWMCGFPDNSEWQIGGDKIWTTSNESAKVGMLELSGSGLSALTTAMDEKESKMAVLGMRILETQKKGAEQPESIRLRMLGDTSTLQSIARMVSHGLSTVLTWAVQWVNVYSPEVIVKLNSDFELNPLNSQDIMSLNQLWQAGGLSYKTLYHNLQRGSLTREGIDSDEEVEQIREEEEERQLLAPEPVVEELPPAPPNPAVMETEAQDLIEAGEDVDIEE